jgi:mxaL protein
VKLPAPIDGRLPLLLLAAACVLLALERPSVLMARPVHRYLVVLDITESMNVRDAGAGAAPTTRLALAKEGVARALLGLRCGSEVGLALFAEHRALVLFAPVEVCEHYGVIRSMLAGLDWRLAWRGGSEIARGLDSSMRATAALGAPTRLVFISDGHEAPPVDARLRRHLQDDAGIAQGLIVGVGGDRLTPIPRLDEDGALVAFWAADVVQQVDNYSLGRHTSERGEQMAGVDAGDLRARIARGTEHLSSLREGYLKELARESGLEYRRAATAGQLSDILRERRYAHAREVPVDPRALLALAGLALLIAAGAWPLRAPRSGA